MEGDKRSWSGHWLWEAGAAKLYKLGFRNLYHRHFVDRTISHCFGFRIGHKGFEWRKSKVGSWRGRRGGVRAKSWQWIWIYQNLLHQGKPLLPFFCSQYKCPIFKTYPKKNEWILCEWEGKVMEGTKGGGQNALLLNTWVGKRGKR